MNKNCLKWCNRLHIIQNNNKLKKQREIYKSITEQQKHLKNCL